MKCDECFKSRAIISENGWHHICGLTEKYAAECITHGGKHFEKIPEGTFVSVENQKPSE